ncbi:formamidopyrimidine-DNA glycosylase isoform 1 [Galdieria sulphuraria]|uniref:Formamidopyrimidine-DNA glycosylase isoform 1 n=1 Tax=Galdieria sulphuraria TaxID=130081 RepID=M2Y1H7_GALSU|nr:formamidopyrimidine-DNA glycosylase isoform 1 [Galdieria sulphuraria]EME29669.1 formamidopyrimidine-DNA glycosylase isoform 1 [Galdieria sulphuraria]|eukprot:XP_005706189.1 formamidopyrimidine-DNA glycosylase isoform 1 [Galdieria sulphuraria]
MPELIQVEYFRQFIQEHLSLDTAVVENIYFSQDASSLFPKGHISMETIPIQVVHKKVIRVQRYGKYLWLELSSPVVYIIFHFGMSGSLAHRKTDGSLEFAHVGKHYSSLIQEWPSQYAKLSPMQLSYITCLGFDPILSNPTIQELYDKIQSYKSAIKTVLLNGSVIAGIGNWMADEILYKSKIHPLEWACLLSLNDVESLWEATKQVVQQGVRVRANSDEFPKDWLFHLRWKKDKAQLGQQKGVKILQVGGRTTLYVASQQRLHKPGRMDSIKDKVGSSPQDSKTKQQPSEKQMRDIYRCLCISEKDGINQQDLCNAVKELESGKWEDDQVIKDAIALFSSNGYSVSWEDFVNIYKQIQSTSK